MITIRKYTPEDFDMIAAWAAERDIQLHPMFLSPNGYVAMHNNECIMCAFVYFVLDVPIVQIDNLFTKPGMHYTKTLKAWQTLINFIKMFLKNVEDVSQVKFHLIRCFTNDKLARALTHVDKDWKMLTAHSSSIGQFLT